MNKRVLLIMATKEFAEKDDRVELKVENVRERPDLLKREKETFFRTEKGQDHAVLDSSEGAVMRNAIQHPHIEVEDYNSRDGSITSVEATMPVGLWLIKSEPRDNPGHSRMFSQPTLRDTGDEE